MSELVQIELNSNLDQLGSVIPPRHRVWIIPHDFPDPDALASACAMHLLLEKHYKVHSQIVFSGEVSRAENKELLRRMRYRWHKLEDMRESKRPVVCILVDTAPWSKNVTLPKFARPVAVLDHHRHARLTPPEGCFLDIRPGHGSTVTMAYEYLRAAGIVIPRWLAAVMCYAISSETLDLSRDSERMDVTTYLELAARADLRIIGKIRHAPLPPIYYARLQEAMTNAFRLENVAWTHLQRVEQPEIVAEITDLLLRMEGVKWSFCTAHMGDRLFVSVRSSQCGAQCARIVRAALGRHGSGGGHNNLAAGYLDLSRFGGEEREERKVAFVRSLVRRMNRRIGEGEESFARATPLASLGT